MRTSSPSGRAGRRKIDKQIVVIKGQVRVAAVVEIPVRDLEGYQPCIAIKR